MLLELPTDMTKQPKEGTCDTKHMYTECMNTYAAGRFSGLVDTDVTLVYSSSGDPGPATRANIVGNWFHLYLI
jgi:hypothetical protein